MKAIIDRFEGETAVLTPAGGGKPFNLAKAVLPNDAASGSTVELIKGSWVILGADSDARRKRISEKARQLFRD
jgi:hypothetical protein